MTDKYGVNEDIFKVISVLLVEDDDESRHIIENKLAGMFSKFTSVSDAEHGIEEFEKNRYDLVITDYFLPGINGLAFTKAILAIKKDTPIIMMTGHMDKDFLMSAVNMGVSQFVAKPVHIKLLIKAVNNAVERVILENMRIKAKEQELELLRLQETHDHFQKQFAMRKEMHLIRNDLFLRFFSKSKDGSFNPNGWNIDVFYESHEIVSGDIYSCYRINDDCFVVLIIDAMGKGVPAAVTATIGVALFSYFINKYISGVITDLRVVIDKFIDVMKTNLLDDEILCLSVVMIDSALDKMWYSAFSMPKIWVATHSGEVRSISSNNMPIMKFTNKIKFDCLDIKDISKILIYSDGLAESPTANGNIYNSYIEEDFKNSFFIKNFEANIKKHVNEFSDDTSIFFIRRPFVNMVYQKEQEVETSFEGIEQLEEFFAENVSKIGLDVISYECFFAAYSEIVMNAYEHGNLGLGSAEKHRYIEENIYEDKLLELEKTCNKKILSRIIFCHSNSLNYVAVSVRDEGEGYPDTIFSTNVSVNTKFNGRGLKIISHYTDDFFFSEDRKEIFIVKLITNKNDSLT